MKMTKKNQKYINIDTINGYVCVEKYHNQKYLWHII